MYQLIMLRIFVIISMKRFFLMSTAYRLPMESESNEVQDSDEEFLPVMQKKSLDIPVPEAEHVCPVTIMKRHRPQYGHMGNGSYVEVQQDSEHSFEATFVECTNGHHRPSCHGIDVFTYSSECVTLYEWRTAFVRLPESNVNFVPAMIKESQLAVSINGFRGANYDDRSILTVDYVKK